MRSGLFVAALPLLLLMPGAGAQTEVVEPTLSLRATPGGEELLAPETGQGLAVLKLSVSCSREEAGRDRFVAEFRLDAQPAYASSFIGPASVPVQPDPGKCVDQTYRHEALSNAYVTTNRDAPAFEVFQVAVSARLVGSGTFGPAQGTYGPVKAAFNVTNGYFALTQAAPETFFQKTKPGRAFAFPVQLSNLGNGASRVDVRLEDVDPRLRIDDVPTLTLQSRAQEGASAAFQTTLAFRGGSPGSLSYVNGVHSFTARITSHSVDARGTDTDEQTMTFTVQVQGGGVLQAGVLLLLVVALAGVLFWRRRRSAA